MAIYWDPPPMDRADQFAVAVLAALVARPDRDPFLYAENNVKLATRMGQLMAEANPWPSADEGTFDLDEEEEEND